MQPAHLREEDHASDPMRLAFGVGRHPASEAVASAEPRVAPPALAQPAVVAAMHEEITGTDGNLVGRGMLGDRQYRNQDLCWVYFFIFPVSAVVAT